MSTKATVKRKAPTARKASAARGKARTVKRAKARTSSFMDAVMEVSPFTEAQLHRVFLAVIIGGAAVLAWTVAAMAGLPAMARQQLAAVSKQAGFEVRRVDVRGVEHLNELKIYERALAQRDRAMPLVDVEALRQSLIDPVNGISWIKDARVSRQLPDTLVIDVVERKPHAVLRKPGGSFVLIDEAGHELERVPAGRAKGELIVSGPAAGRQMAALTSLLEAAPAIKPQVREAEWIGNRRWNLKFKTGQILALPEGGKEASGALVAFARLDGTNRLIGGKVVAFDMRSPDRVYLRIPDRGKQEAALNAGAARRTEVEAE